MSRAIHSLFYLAIFAAIVLGVQSCEKNDDEPVLPATRISRLYVSFSDVQPDDLAEPFDNIGVFDPADSATFPTMESFNSKAVEGAGIFYNPYAKRVFQSSIQDFSVKTFSVSLTGVLGPASSFIDSTLSSQYDLAYDHSSLNLYVSNNLTNSIHVYNKAATRNGVLQYGPDKKFILTAQPRGLVLDNDSLMLVLRSGSSNQIALLENPSKIDSGKVELSKVINLPEAEDLRGLAYSARLDLLITSDVKNGKIFLIEGARSVFSGQASASAISFIGGAKTELIEPVDVSIDDREEKGYIYVADRKQKTIYRFSVEDRGDVSPGAKYAVPLTPVSLYIDAR